MATYKQITEWVKVNYGYTAKGCWIADRKAFHGLSAGRPHVRKGTPRKYPCPVNKRGTIDAALRHFGMIG